ncbi:hypothetical protein DRO38_02490 [Candidatus Bathyarchaeota archaeon]|nr:MAG: hypothetical protein DRP69_05005 [Candidatus Omnitrophota bacterium]RKY42626.1 MAG: hypothetical protein DRP80_06595 [Candidatus Omnitrophota bacterium]RLI03640.1 MAG: hypothetical protein DRO38_02490 [Candidatus Bathyarchaeota archaeon]
MFHKKKKIWWLLKKVSFYPLIGPNFTVFISSFCIMVVEIVAGRIIARFLGASLYTWTSVIGVVLAGIALGNFSGGFLADRFQSGRVLSALFVLSSISCVSIPILNRAIGDWQLLWYLPWPARITLHVTLIFLLPSAMLGMISPVVAKFALDKGLRTGWTVGNLYAWAALGSIVGTFVTGFFLIAWLGTARVIWSISLILGLMGFFFAIRAWVTYCWLGILLLLILVSSLPQDWAKLIGQRLGLRSSIDSKIVYQTESQYSYIKVQCLADVPSVRELILDQLVHSKVYMDEPSNIYEPHQYPYIKMYGDFTRFLSKDKKKLSCLFIGGGGYVLPRYIQKHWPGSHIEVVEIDPEVTQTAVKALGLSPESAIEIHHLDARNYIDELIIRKQQGENIASFDFIYGDSINDLTVPYQLTTYEFNEKVRKLLSPEGIYMINLIDSLSSEQFLGAVINTFKKSFPYVYAFQAGSSKVKRGVRNTFIVLGSPYEIDFTLLLQSSDFAGSLLNETQLKVLKERSRGIILTDDYAPVENLLEPVVRQRWVYSVCNKFTELGNQLLKEGRYKEAGKYYYKTLRVDPDFLEAHNNLGVVLESQGKLDEAIKHYKRVLEINPEYAEVHINLGNVLTRQGRTNEAIEHYQKALEIDPDLEPAYVSLGNVFVRQGRFNQAIKYYRRVLEINPDNFEVHNNLGTILARQGKFDEAIRHYRKALEIKPDFREAQYNLNLAIEAKGESEKK